MGSENEALAVGNGDLLKEVQDPALEVNNQSNLELDIADERKTYFRA